MFEWDILILMKKYNVWREFKLKFIVGIKKFKNDYLIEIYEIFCQIKFNDFEMIFKIKEFGISLNNLKMWMSNWILLFFKKL